MKERPILFSGAMTAPHRSLGLVVRTGDRLRRRLGRLDLKGIVGHDG